MAATKTRKQTEITAATVNRVIDKATGKVLGYLVKSDSEQGVYYQVTWDASRHCYKCSGEKCGKAANCKHRRAVQSVLAARKELARENNLCSFFAALAQFAQQQATEQAIAEAEKVVQPPHRYCDVCQCAAKLHKSARGMVCEACDVQSDEEAEYEAWKKANGLDRRLSREEYEVVFNIYG